MEQVPMATSVTVEPDTEQTPGEAEAKLTARPEDAVALTANGAVPNGWFESVPKVIAWPVSELGTAVSVEKLVAVVVPSRLTPTVKASPSTVSQKTC
jgi:hypothetical protein